MTDDEARKTLQHAAIAEGRGYVSLQDIRKHRIEGATVFVGGPQRVTFIVTDDGGPVSEQHVAAVLALPE